MECITITVPCLLLNPSLIMGWYFGVLMNEELQMVKHLSKQVSMPLYYTIFKAKTSGITIKEV
jgi:hypothetical protein